MITCQCLRNPPARGHVMCAIDVETTGLLPGYNELTQIAILPFDKSKNFNLYIKPSHPERVDAKGAAVVEVALKKAMTKGVTPEEAAKKFEQWFDATIAPYKIIPVGHNFGAFDMPFIREWLSHPIYREYFHDLFRDTMVIVNYYNDKVKGLDRGRLPLKLEDLCDAFGIKRLGKPHDALSDCKVVHELYTKFLEFSI